MGSHVQVEPSLFVSFGLVWEILKLKPHRYTTLYPKMISPPSPLPPDGAAYQLCLAEEGRTAEYCGTSHVVLALRTVALATLDR